MTSRTVKQVTPRFFTSREVTSFLEMLPKQLAFADDTSPLHKPKARWAAEEDEALLNAIEERGPKNWNSIALALNGRTGKQCRERWITKHSPEFSSEAWTPIEDASLIRLQALHGNQWARFKAELPRRSTTSIKNRWVSLRRRTISKSEEAVEQEEVASTVIVDYGEEADSGQEFAPFDDQFSFESFSWFV
jgi:hypothetical protein